MFALETVTQLCHSYSKTFVAVIILPNRAGDLRASPIKHHANDFFYGTPMMFSFMGPAMFGILPYGPTKGISSTILVSCLHPF